MLIEVDPTTTAGPLFAQDFFRHEVVRRFHTDTDIYLIHAVGQLDAFPKLITLGVIFAVVKFLDSRCMHILRAILCSSVRERTEATREEVNDRQFQFWEKVFKF